MTDRSAAILRGIAAVIEGGEAYDLNTGHVGQLNTAAARISTLTDELLLGWVPPPQWAGEPLMTLLLQTAGAVAGVCLPDDQTMPSKEIEAAVLRILASDPRPSDERPAAGRWAETYTIDDDIQRAPTVAHLTDALERISGMCDGWPDDGSACREAWPTDPNDWCLPCIANNALNPD